MIFKNLLNDFLDYKCDEKKFKAQLCSFQPTVWGVGLEEEEVHLCIQIFIEFELADDTRAELLHCLVPRDKIPGDSVNALFAWFFTFYKKKNVAAKKLLLWFSVMLANKLIDEKPWERNFNQFLICFNTPELISSLCQVLKHVVNHKTVTPRSVFIASSYFYKEFVYPEKKYIGCLLRLFYSCSPSLLPHPPSGNQSLPNLKDNFSNAVSLLAFHLGFLSSLPEGNELSISVSKTNISKKKELFENTFCKQSNELTAGNSGIQHLGWMTKMNEIPSIHSASSVLGSRAGQIYICWQHIIGNDLPSEDKFTVFPALKEILETCQRMRSGLPYLPSILSKHLISWDGEVDRDILYNVLSMIHFESFADLYNNILCHIVDMFFTGLLIDKVYIIDCLTTLLALKVTAVRPEVSCKLITFVCRLIKVATAADGLETSALLITCVKFYHRVSLLEERYKLGTWTIPPPFLVFGALFSRNHVLISNICELIVRHNIIMYVLYTALGIIQNFRDEEEIIKTYLRDIYLFLWKGQASKTELMTDENEMLPGLSQEAIDPLFTVRSHCGIQQLMLFAIHCHELESTKRISDKSVMKVLDRYAPGICEIKRVYEGNQNDISQGTPME